MRAFGKVLFTLGAVAVLRTRCEDDDFDGEEMEEGVGELSLSSEQVRGVHGKADADGNGKVSLKEFMSFSEKMRKIIASKDISMILEEMDADKDGKLSLDELIKDMERMSEGDEEAEDKSEKDARIEVEKSKFKAADKNGDGLLDKEEVPALFYPEIHEGVLEITAKAALKSKDKNGDGKLSNREFWETDVVDGEEQSIAEEELADFKKLDKNGDGFLDLEELKAWESGRFHTEQAMKTLIELADKDRDMHVSADELDGVREQIAGTESQYHLMEWAEHNEL